MPKSAKLLNLHCNDNTREFGIAIIDIDNNDFVKILNEYNLFFYLISMLYCNSVYCYIYYL